MNQPLTILYEDKFIIVAVKPVGVLSEDTTDGTCMPELLREHLKTSSKSTYVATVHRLDKVVGGVMVFSKNPAATGKLIAAIQEHKVTKEYLAILRGHPEQPEAELKDLLFRDSTKNKSFVVQRMRKGVREASLDYKELGQNEDLSLVRVHLHTGRTHQIRVQFSSRSLPLLGDIRYGSKAACSTALWSWHLSFEHPMTHRQIDVFCPPPQSYPWDLFSQELYQNP